MKVFLGMTAFTIAASFVVYHAQAQGQPFQSFAVPITIQDGNMEFKTYAESSSVENVLKNLGIDRTENDLVSPPLETQTTFGSRIIITRSNAIHINDGGELSEHTTHVTTVGELLAEAGLKLSERDRIEPVLITLLTPGMTISITRVTDEEKTQEEGIAFETKYEDDASLYRGETKVVQEGKNGKKEMTYRISLENGKEVKRELLSEEVFEEPVTKVVKRGTKEQIGKVLTGNASWYRNGGGMTTAARDWRRGTRLRVTNLENGKVITVTVVGYGPQPYTGRVLDLGSDAFEALSTLGDGVIRVKVEELL